MAANHRMSQTPQTPLAVSGMDILGESYRADVDAEGNLSVRNLIWNIDTLSWEAATGSLGAGGAVEVTNFPATQPVSGSISVSNLPATQPVSGTVSVSNLPAANPLAAYHASDIDAASDPNYFGFLDGSGNWYILRLTNASGQARYVKGTSGYAAAWTGRAGLSYDLFSNVF